MRNDRLGIRSGDTVRGWVVSDIATTIRRLAERGVEFDRYEGADQDKLRICSAAGGA